MSNHKSKLGLTWEVNLEKDTFVNKETFEIFNMGKNYDLHTLFGVIDEEKFVSQCINLIVDEDGKEIVSEGFDLNDDVHDNIFEVVESIGNFLR